MILLPGHISKETAYVVEDYPYGFHLRCKIRYWLEDHPAHGVRVCSQTTNPKKPGEVWNKEKKSTYWDVACALYIDEETGHVKWAGVSNYDDYGPSRKFQDVYGPAVPDTVKPRLARWIEIKRVYEAKLKKGMNYQQAGREAQEEVDR